MIKIRQIEFNLHILIYLSKKEKIQFYQQQLSQIQMQEEPIGSQQKLTFIIQNRAKLPQVYQKDVQNLTTSSFAGKIKIQTFFKTLQPLIYSYSLQIPKSEVEYPIATVIALPYPEQPYHHVSLKVATWIESGGLRCIPLKSGAGEKDIEKSFALSHCLICPDWNNEEPEGIKDFIENLMRIYAQVPMLFIGKSALKVLEILVEGFKYSFQVENGFSEIYISHQSFLLNDMELPLRLCLENRKKISFPFVNNFEQIEYATSFKKAGIMINRSSGQQVTSIVENTQKRLFFIFNNPCGFDNPDSITFWHKIIVNFVNEARRIKKLVNQKQIQKVLLAMNKITIKGSEEKGHYKIL